jgi:hypothetical protein
MNTTSRRINERKRNSEQNESRRDREGRICVNFAEIAFELLSECWRLSPEIR